MTFSGLFGILLVYQLTEATTKGGNIMKKHYLFTEAKLNTNLKDINTLNDLFDLTTITPFTLYFDRLNGYKKGTSRILNGELFIFFFDKGNILTGCEVRPYCEKKWYSIKQCEKE